MNRIYAERRLCWAVLVWVGAEGTASICEEYDEEAEARAAARGYSSWENHVRVFPPGVNSSREMELSMEPFSEGFMRVTGLHRGDMELSEWTDMVESWARNLASRMGGTARIDWHGHAEIFVMPLDAMYYLRKEDEETGEILETPVNPWLRLWVD